MTTMIKSEQDAKPFQKGDIQFQMYMPMPLVGMGFGSVNLKYPWMVKMHP